MSDIVFTCLHCGQSLAVEDRACGITVACPECLKQIVVPTASTECPPCALDEPSKSAPLSNERNTQSLEDSRSVRREHPAQSSVTSTSGKPILADKRLFAILRWMVVGVSLGIIFSIIVAGMHLQKIRSLLANHISYQDIQKSLRPAATTAPLPDSKSAPEIKFPDSIKKYYSGRNSRELLEWLEKIDSGKRADFVANLAAVIKEAEAQKAPDMRAVVGEYQRQKKLTPDFRVTDAFSARPTILVLISFVVFLIGMLLAFFCLLLILLAAEKKASFHQEPMEQ